MSTDEAERPVPPPGDKGAEPGDPEQEQGAEQPPAGEEQDRPQNAWSARRDLRDHSPRTMRFAEGAGFGGSAVGGDQHGVSGGRVAGDVIMGGKTEIYYQFGPLGASATASSGEIPKERLDRLARLFVSAGTDFDELVERLREERVLVLSGARHSGRWTAALMLLHSLGADCVRLLDRDTSPGELAGRLGGEAEGVRGYVLRDPLTRRGQPLRDTHLLAARDKLADDGFLVITVGPNTALEGIRGHAWRPPAPGPVLEAGLRALVGADRSAQLLARPEVAEFLGRNHQVREAALYAAELGKYALGQTGETEIADFSLAALEGQVQEWFEEDESVIHLRDKAFLVALAAFDGGPYALTAELSDLLYAFLQKTENPGIHPTVPVFGTHIGKRLQLARADSYQEEEHTEWGPVTQFKASYHDDRAALVLLREVWTGHPSARPALVRWLQRLADDGRPLVRTRAASTVAVLTRTDLPSTMALVIEPWACSKTYRRRLVAANALALAHLLGTPNIPRILDGWCQGEDAGPAWAAVRAHSLIGPERPEETLAALRGAVRKQYEKDGDAGQAGQDGQADELMLKELADAVSLLLLSEARDRVLAELLRTLDDDRPVQGLALGGFISACGHTEDDERYGTPLVLDWYAKAAGGPTGHYIAALWRRALGDRTFTRPALDVLRDWVLIADRAPAAEWALAALLPALVTTATEHQRVSHLLRTMPGEDGAPPPPVAGRLATALGPGPA